MHKPKLLDFRPVILEFPYTYEEILSNIDKNNGITGIVAVTLSDIVSDDIESFRDRISEMLVGNEVLKQVEYNPLYVTEEGEVVIQVYGILEDLPEYEDDIEEINTLAGDEIPENTDDESQSDNNDIFAQLKEIENQYTNTQNVETEDNKENSNEEEPDDKTDMENSDIDDELDEDDDLPEDSDEESDDESDNLDDDIEDNDSENNNEDDNGFSDEGFELPF